MDRRLFFRRAGVGVVGAALAPAVAVLATDQRPDIEVDPIKAAGFVADNERIKVRVDLVDAAGGVLLSQVLQCRARSGRLVGYNVLLHGRACFVNTTGHAIDVVGAMGSLPWWPEASWTIQLEGGRIQDADDVFLDWPKDIVVVLHP